jgi:acetolactate synthase I/II/III large subunit
VNGAESLVHTAVAAGLELCLANPGTTEMPLVAALDAAPAPGIRPVLGLFEGVCTGAADGYARIAGRPALTLLHLGPGFANGLANLHNARRAHTPMVVLVGDHATWHRAADPPLATELEGLAQVSCDWVRRSRSGKEVAGDFADALAAALEPPGGAAALILPTDCQWEAANGPATPRQPARPRLPSAECVAEIARALGTGAPAGLFLGGSGLRSAALAQAARVAAATGCRLLCGSFPAAVERGTGVPAVERLPYFPEDAIRSLAPLAQLVLVGAPEPVAFFGYPDVPSRLAPRSCVRHVLADPACDVEAALAALGDALGAPRRVPIRAAAPSGRPPASGALDASSLGAVVASLQPEAAIVVDEALTSGASHWSAAAGAPPHTQLCLTGGAIGMGLPAATGAALAAPGRHVLCLQADGSGMYTLQALWTQAREALDVTSIICANRRYRILELERERAGMGPGGAAARAFTELAPPALDWCALARGLGVPAERAERVGDLARALERALSEPGPHLIEAILV